MRVAELRADLHNTSAKQYDRVFESADFMPGATRAIEERVAELIAQGYDPAAAAAIATSKQSKDKQLRTLGKLKGPGAKPAGRPAAGKRPARVKG
jgi:hypothetical protein